MRHRGFAASRFRQGAACVAAACAAAVAALQPANAATVLVNVGPGMVFIPQFPVINAGDTLRFVNNGGWHNVVADDQSFRCARGCDGDGENGDGSSSNTNWVARVRFDETGSFGYFCETHGKPGQGMWGRVKVVLFQSGFE